MGRNDSQNEREMKRKRRLIRHEIDEITMEILNVLSTIKEMMRTHYRLMQKRNI